MTEYAKLPSKPMPYTHPQPQRTGPHDGDLHFSSVDAWLDHALALATESDGVLPELQKRLYGNFRDMFSGAPRHSLETTKNGWLGDTAPWHLIKMHRDFAPREKTRTAIHSAPAELPPLYTEQLDSLQDQITLEESGVMLDTIAYYNGEEQCMLYPAPTPQPRPIIWIGVCLGGTADIKPFAFLNRGIALIRAVHALERQSVGVGLFGYSYAKNCQNGAPEDAHLQTVTVKAPDEPLDETNLITATTESAIFRSVGFINRSAGCGHGEGFNSGSTKTVPHSRLEGTQYAEHRLVVLPYSNSQMKRGAEYGTAERATEYTLEQIRRQAGQQV